ncbi:Ulp1 family isopeptidase [Mesorhizobium shangrilense]|uniref:Ulp1 family isopeptidase n=1 Tax=Mesorhizobium shangrilense TaxID=460060 RepID=A0ABV2DM47_9HYPH
MHQYAALQEQQRARQQSDNMPAGQASFERQLSDLQLSSSDESSGDAGSPNTRPEEAHGSIQRTDVGGSMRMPPQSNLQDNWFSSTRYSVDIPRAHLGSTAKASQSDLRDRPFSSTRYTVPSEPGPVARTKDKKSGGLWSRVKSGLGKAFGGSRYEKSSGGSASDVYSELRMDFAKRSRPSDADLELIGEFKVALEGENRRPKTIQNYVTALRMFSEFLQPEGVTLEDLLGDAEMLEAYKAGFMKVASANSSNYLGGALDTLQLFRAGNPISTPAWVDAQDQPMHPQDERIIRQFAEEVKAYNIVPDGSRGRGTGRVPAPTVKSNVQVLKAFARWLRNENKGPLTTRAFNEPRSLAIDIEEYTAIGGDGRDRLDAALSHLRRVGAERPLAVGAGPRLMGRGTLYAHPEDVPTIDGLQDEALAKLGPDATREQKAAVSIMASKLRAFSDWLQRESRESIVSRIDGSAQQQASLKSDHVDFTKATKRKASLGQLRQYLGVEPQPLLRPYPDDARIINGLANDELSKLGSDRTSRQRRKPIQDNASGQRRFSDWLQTTGRESIVSRINGSDQQQRSLDVDYRDFTKAKGKIGMRLKQLGQYLRVVEANRALGVAFPKQPSREPRLDGSSPSWSPQIPSDFDPSEWPTPEGPQAGRHETAGSSSTWSPRMPSDYDPNEWPTFEGSQAGWPEAARSSLSWSPRIPSDFDPSEWPTPEGPPAMSSDSYGGLDFFLDLPSTPQETRDDAQSAPVPSPAARPPFFIGPSGEPQELEDIGHLVGEDWQHGSQPVPDFLLDVLDNKMLLPSLRMVTQPVSINGETYSITLGPRGSRDAQFIHHPRPSSVPDAQINASATSASSGGRSGRVLGAREWLGDDHIQRDYELLAQELRGTNPDLATRTRFVDPLIAFQLSHGADSDSLSALHRIVFRNGGDTADFVFLPVNNASANRDGDHWSLLLVDRRERERPVAYHYDSAQGHNDEPAALLAARIGANLQDASMRQQKNGYDCGVFVVDGTRALIRRLAVRRQPDLLNLDNLVADRRALQNRLRG